MRVRRLLEVIDNGPWYPSSPARQIAGFDDPTDLLGPGVYILERQGKVVYVAWAKNVLDRIADHRRLADQNMPSWFPVKGIIFDHFHFRRCASDVGETLVAELVAQYKPHHNHRPNSHATPALS